MRRSLFVPLLTKTAIAIRMVSNITQSPEPGCVGTSTYDFEPLETVFVTVDGSYTYTGLTNETKPSDIYYTPPPPCSSVIIVNNSTQSFITTVITIPVNATSRIESVVTFTTSTLTTICKPRSSSSTSISTSTKSVKNGPYLNVSSTTTSSSTAEDCSLTLIEFATTITESPTATHAAGNPANPHPRPQVPTAAADTSSVPPEQSPSAAPVVELTTVTQVNGPPATARTRVTVTVTKKTPVLQTTPAPSTNGAGVNVGPTFPQNNQPITIKSTSPRPNPPDTQPGTNLGGVNTVGGNNPGLAPISIPSDNSGNNDSARPVASSSPGQGNSNAGGNNNNAVPTASASPVPTIGGGSGLGAIINSVFNSPFTAVIGVSTSLGAASATVTLLGGVPVQVGPSSVYIGGSYVPLPTGSSSSVITVAGETFTVLSTAVVVGTSTLGFIRQESVSYSAIQAVTQAASTITRSGVIVTIQPTAAVVSGTTYTIGLNAPSTTAVVNGQTLTFNNNGVVFGSSTYAPALITAPAYVVTTIGSLIISIDQSQAIISGTTYSIGAGSSGHKTTAVVDGTTITFGPSGIILPSQTIAPTSVQLTGLASKTSASAATRVLSDPSGTTTSNTGATSRTPSFLSNMLCTTIMTLALATLPLSLLL